MYHGLDEYQTVYKMVIPKEEYFLLAIPSILLLHSGLYLLPVKIFEKDFDSIQVHAKLNEPILKQWIIAGVLLRLVMGVLPGDIAFIVYLLSSIRFVAAFGLIIINFKKYWIYLAIVFGVEVSVSLAQGMFHDAVMWFAFFALLACKLFKPSLLFKTGAMLFSILFLFLLQKSKQDYREKTWFGTEEAGFSTFGSSFESSAQDADVLSIDGISSAFMRVNQGWIFASTVDNMNQSQDFQQWRLLGLYTEAAMLPRFLAPEKLKAGSRELFNQYSGRFIGEGTAMGLGILADGYISFGAMGVFAFAFGFGFIFCLIFRIVEGWTSISPFFLLFIFPILHYAVRPDCETQTVLGHIVKALLLYGCMMVYYKGYFIKIIKIIEKKERLNPNLSFSLKT